jgi:hypothetical protein
MSPHVTRARGAAALLLVLLVVSTAFAGPPLLCHPFDIGPARSLPWAGIASWYHGRSDYDRSTLVRDTEALLAQDVPVVVRMETIRRAAIYASEDARTAAALVARFGARARSSDPLALLDAALLTETLRQLGRLGESPALRERVRVARAVVGQDDGRDYLTRALASRPHDPAYAFAAALVEAGTNRQAFEAYAKRARAGAAQDSLLARNLHHVN